MAHSRYEQVPECFTLEKKNGRNDLKDGFYKYRRGLFAPMG